MFRFTATEPCPAAMRCVVTRGAQPRIPYPEMDDHSLDVVHSLDTWTSSHYWVRRNPSVLKTTTGLWKDRFDIFSIFFLWTSKVRYTKPHNAIYTIPEPPKPIVAPSPPPQPAGKSKKAKKKAKKAAAAAESRPEPTQEGTKMVTLRNPMFHPNLPPVQVSNIASRLSLLRWADYILSRAMVLIHIFRLFIISFSVSNVTSSVKILPEMLCFEL